MEISTLPPGDGNCFVGDAFSRSRSPYFLHALPVGCSFASLNDRFVPLDKTALPSGTPYGLDPTCQPALREVVTCVFHPWQQNPCCGGWMRRWNPLRSMAECGVPPFTRNTSEAMKAKLVAMIFVGTAPSGSLSVCSGKPSPAPLHRQQLITSHLGITGGIGSRIHQPWYVLCHGHHRHLHG